MLDAAWASRVVRQSSVNRGNPPRPASCHARSETEAKASPGGVISAFCDPATTTSTPQASVASSTPPRLDTASTTSAAPVGRSASAIARTSWTTPVDVSECVTNTAAQPSARSAINSASSRSPHSWTTRSGSSPYAWTIFAQRSPKLPADATSTRSPGESRFATADSIAEVPDPANISTGSAVANTRPRPASVCSRSSLKSGLRWWISGNAIAVETSGGMGVGPGVIRYVLSGTDPV